MADQDGEAEQDHAQEAFDILRNWQWGYFDPDGEFHASRMPLNELINRLAFSGHPEPKAAVLTLFLKGRLKAMGRYDWATYRVNQEYRLTEMDAPIELAQWVKLQSCMAYRLKDPAEPDWLWNTVDLPKLGFEDVPVADWRPEHSRLSYACCSQGKGQADPDYFEEYFNADELEILPLVVACSDEDVVSMEDQATAGRGAIGARQGLAESRGRRPKYDWTAASLAVFGKIHRGDLKPECQADIERALIAHLSDENGGPSESATRPYAKLIWEESQKA